MNSNTQEKERLDAAPLLGAGVNGVKSVQKAGDSSNLVTMERYFREGKFYHRDPETGEEVECGTTALRERLGDNGTHHHPTEFWQALPRTWDESALESVSTPSVGPWGNQKGPQQ